MAFSSPDAFTNLGVSTGLLKEDSNKLADIKTGFAHGYIFELRDTKDPKSSLTFALVLNPNEINISEPIQTTLTPNEADSVVEETNGIITREITIGGTFGLKERTGSTQAGTGNAHYLAFRALIQEYSKRKQDPERNARTKLVFHSLREDLHLFVVPKLFETPRTAQRTRYHYEYRLSMTSVPGDPGYTPPKGEDLDFFDKAANAFGKAFAVINDAQAAMLAVNADLSHLATLASNITAVMLQVTAMIDLAANAITNVDNLILTPKRLWDSVTQILSDSIDDVQTAINNFTLTEGHSDKEQARLAASDQQLRTIEASLLQVSMFPSLFADQGNTSQPLIEKGYLGALGLTEQDLLDGDAGATASTRTLTNRGTAKDNGSAFGKAQSYQRVQLDVTSTLDALATKYGTTPELIAIVNNLSAPYITSGGGDGTVGPGDSILVPLSTASAATGLVASFGDPLAVDDALYGVDLALDPAALAEGLLDIRVDDLHGSMGAQLAHGVDNVKQGLAIVLNTELGETQFLPDLGVAHPVGKKGTVSNMLLTVNSYRSAILSDPRVTGISSSSITLDKDVLTYVAVPEVLGRREDIPVVLPIGLNQ